MKGIVLAIFFILFTSLGFYYRFEWYSFAEYIKNLSIIFGINLFIFVAVVIKEVAKKYYIFFCYISGLCFYNDDSFL